MLRHLPFFITCTAEKDEFLGRLVDDILAIGRKAGLVKEKRCESNTAPIPPHYFYGAKTFIPLQAPERCETNIILLATIG